MTRCFIFLGPPGSGKGTQAERLAVKYKIKKISTGDLIRDELDKETNLNERIHNQVLKGQLIDDDIVIQLVKNNISNRMQVEGFVCDGVPRTYKQAVELDKIINEVPIFVLFLEIGLDDLIKRIMGRSTCIQCKLIYHNIYKPPKEVDKCDECGGKLVLREDDSKKVLIKRFKYFEKNIKSILNYYKGRLIKIDAAMSASEVFKAIESTL
jgi:adenylate kinase